MDDNTIHQWLIDCFGPMQGEMAWKQFSQLPDGVRDQLMSQDPSQLPKPEDVQSMIQAFTAGGLNTPSEMERTVEEGPINIKLARTIALRGSAEGEAAPTISAKDAQRVKSASSEANLWLDTACHCDPVPDEVQALTRSGWVRDTLESWAGFTAPVAKSMGDALSSVLSSRFGDSFDGHVTGLFAGPVPIPLPDEMSNPRKLMQLLGNTSFAMQLGHAAGELSHEVRGSFDQGVALSPSPAGGLIVQNIDEYAASLEIDPDEVLSFVAAREAAHARLFNAVPWLMPRFEALIGKYARGVDIDLDAVEEQLRDAQSMDPESISGAMNLTNVGIADTPEQSEALASLEILLALVEGWVDAVVWRACMPHVPHIEQLREMVRRERAVGGPAERTFESLLGLHLRPRRMRDAAAIWERIGVERGIAERDRLWSHPDLLPELPREDGEPGTSSTDSATRGSTSDGAATTDDDTDDGTTARENRTPASGKGPDAGSGPQSPTGSGIDWDAELNRLLASEGGSGNGSGSDDDGSSNDGSSNDGSSNDGGTNDGTDGSTNGGGNDSATDGEADSDAGDSPTRR